jgi:hypothetical protein
MPGQRYLVADVTGAAPSPQTCTHVDQIHDVSPSTTEGCEDCLREGSTWVHLRECLVCGHVGCCDSSPRRHATRHFHGAGHPLVRSAEPGEDWAWCYADQVFLLPAEAD